MTGDGGRGRRDFREKVLLYTGVGVIAVWAIAVLVQVALPSHEVPTAVTVIALPVATALFGSAWVSGRKPPQQPPKEDDR